MNQMPISLTLELAAKNNILVSLGDIFPEPVIMMPLPESRDENASMTVRIQESQDRILYRKQEHDSQCLVLLRKINYPDLKDAIISEIDGLSEAQLEAMNWFKRHINRHTVVQNLQTGLDDHWIKCLQLMLEDDQKIQATLQVDLESIPAMCQHAIRILVYTTEIQYYTRMLSLSESDNPLIAHMLLQRRAYGPSYSRLDLAFLLLEYTRNIRLTRDQVDMVHQLEQPEECLVCVPVGGGKTTVAPALLERIVLQGKKALFILPNSLIKTQGTLLAHLSYKSFAKRPFILTPDCASFSDEKADLLNGLLKEQPVILQREKY